MDFVSEIYKIIDEFPDKERFALSSQIRRAAISIPSNIAEGTGRFSQKEKIHFNEISMGSLTEVVCQIEIAFRVGYIRKEEFYNLKSKASRIGMMLSGYRLSLLNKPPTINHKR